MMLRHLGYADTADRLESAIDAVYAAEDRLTHDQGGSATTSEFCNAVGDRLA